MNLVQDPKQKVNFQVLADTTQLNTTIHRNQDQTKADSRNVKHRAQSAALSEQKKRQDQILQLNEDAQNQQQMSPNQKKKDQLKFQKDSSVINQLMMLKQKQFRINKSRQQEIKFPQMHLENIDFFANIEEFQNSFNSQKKNFTLESTDKIQKKDFQTKRQAKRVSSVKLINKINYQTTNKNTCEQKMAEVQKTTLAECVSNKSLVENKNKSQIEQQFLSKKQPEQLTHSTLRTQIENTSKVVDKKNIIQLLIEQNKIKLGEQIGEGAYGKVYRGFLLSGSFVAVKQINLNQPNEKICQTLQQEIALLQKLNHPNIVKYYGCQYNQTNINIYLEYMSGKLKKNILFKKGGSLSSRLKLYGAFPECLIKRFVVQIVQGLVYLHSQGVVHRDLKGGNILSDEKGNVKLADFGAARLIEIYPSQNMSQSEMVSSIKGSLYWMAPELLLQQLHGRRIDVWSLGCTIIEMATGTHPWEPCTTFSDLLKQVIKNKCPQIPAHLSLECQDFIRQCCNFDKNARPKSHQLLKHIWIRSK